MLENLDVQPGRYFENRLLMVGLIKSTLDDWTMGPICIRALFMFSCIETLSFRLGKTLLSNIFYHIQGLFSCSLVEGLTS